MHTSPPRFWDGVLRRLGAEVPPFALEAWIGPLVARNDERDGSSGERLTLGCPTAFHRDRVRERFLPDIERCAALEAGVPVAVDLVVAPPLRGAAPTEAPPRSTAVQVAPSAPPPPPSSSGNGGAKAPDAQRELPYRFDNFVVGTCNVLAREASLAVARSTQRALNPLVLAAREGLGKTHLARAIVNEARAHGEARVIYASAEAFTNDFTHSLLTRRADEFKRRFRHGCRLLVLEDVQFLDARKKATQLELFHTLSHLLDVGARVVLTADRLPRDIEGLDPRLRSKLSSGLVAELEAPDAIVRREILRQKAADGGVRLPDACRELIVESVRGSVRDLEGVLIQLVATASLLKRPIDPELTLIALRKLAPIQSARRALAIHDVVETLAAYFKRRPDELAARSRRRDVLLPRQLAMYLCHRYTSASLSEIGAALGRDHSAASNAVRKVERQILECAPLRYQVEALCARLDGMTGECREGR
jgi:chromosomal replication initiator protein